MKKVTALFSAIVLALGLSVAMAAPAQAAASDCPANRVCYWDDSGWVVLLESIWRAGGVCVNVAFNDRANGFRNNLSKHVQMYKDAGCTGPLLRNWQGSTGPFPPGHTNLFFKPFCCGDGDQNKLTSIFVNTG
jgi:hypothetical protein